MKMGVKVVITVIITIAMGIFTIAKTEAMKATAKEAGVNEARISMSQLLDGDIKGINAALIGNIEDIAAWPFLDGQDKTLDYLIFNPDGTKYYQITWEQNNNLKKIIIDDRETAIFEKVLTKVGDEYDAYQWRLAKSKNHTLSPQTAIMAVSGQFTISPSDVANLMIVGGGMLIVMMIMMKAFGLVNRF
jgi:hypothetical protein